jgi:hypothetical protein
MRCDEIVRVFAPISLGERRYQPLLLRLAVVLRNAVVTYGQFITHYNYCRKTTWPEFQPSLPPGQGHLVFQFNPDEGQSLYRLGSQPTASSRNVRMACPPEQANRGVT